MRYSEIMESRVDLDPRTERLTVEFDPQTISYDDFVVLRRKFLSLKDHAYEFVVNGVSYASGGDASRAIVALLQPRIDAAKAREEARQERWRTAWMQAHPELEGLVDLVPTRWLTRFPGNELREPDVTELAKDIRENGIKWPLIITVGQHDRRATLSEGNHRLKAAQQVGMEFVPARVIVYKTLSKRLYSYDVADDLLIPAEGYVPQDMRPSDVFRSLRK